MRTRITSLILGAMTAALLVAAPVAAGDKRAVITLDVNIATGVETFTATGNFCPAGTAQSTSFRAAGRPVFHVDKTFTCSNGSTLSISLDATATWTGTSGGWTVKGGTGDWAGASGGGQITGVSTSSTTITDTYTGSITR